MTSLFAQESQQLQPGLIHYPGKLRLDEQAELRDSIRELVHVAPLFQPRMPRTGKPFSVRMTNCGELGWVADKKGYRYQPYHPDTGNPWPAMPKMVEELWAQLSAVDSPAQACLINFYEASARMGMHQDNDEQAPEAPVISISLGDTARFRFGGSARGGKTRSIKLESGDVLVMGGDSRFCFHGIDRIYPGSSSLLKQGGRLNLTLRRVN